MEETLLVQKDKLKKREQLRNSLMSFMRWIRRHPFQECMGGELEQVIASVVSTGDVELENMDRESVLMRAARSGNLEIVRIFIGAGVDIDAVDDLRRTALIHAVQGNGKCELIEFLVGCGTDMNVSDSVGCKPITCASMSGRMNIVKFFVERGVDVESVGHLNRSALFLAVYYNHFDVAQFLVERGANVNAVDAFGSTSLIVAAENNELDIVRFLVENNANVNTMTTHSKRTALMEAVRKDNLEMTKLLFERGANIHDVDDEGSTILIQAAAISSVGIIIFLIECGANVNGSGRTPLMVASMRGDFNIIRVLIENGADLTAADFNRNTPIMIAAKTGKLDVVCFLVDFHAGPKYNFLFFFFIYYMKKKKRKLLIKAAASGNLDDVRQLLGGDSNINIAKMFGRTLLMCAAERGKMSIVQFLVEDGTDVNAIDRRGCTPLIHASKREHWDIVHFLVCSGADVNAVDKFDGSTALFHAAKYGQLGIIQDLVEKGADVDVADLQGMTPVMFAAENKNLEIVRLLIDSGANAIDLDNYKGMMLLHATEIGNYDGIRYLLKEASQFNTADSSGKTLLMWAALSGNLDNVQILIKGGADVNATDQQNYSPLLHACKSRHWDIVRFLASKGADVNAVDKFDGSTALFHAAKYGQLGIIQDLVDKGADVNAVDLNNSTPAMFAANAGNLEVVCFLVESGADITHLKNKEAMMLMHAAESGNLDDVRQQLGEDSDINIAKMFGRILLMFAAEEGKMDIVKFLVDSGVSANARDRHNCTPLMHASKRGRWNVVRFLVNSGADVNAVGKSGWTSLLYAVQENRLEIIQFLIDVGADVNTSTKYWPTSLLNNASDHITRVPLIEAAEKDRLEAVEFLVDRGAGVNSIGSDGKTALMQAAAKGNFKIIEFLSQSGAKFDVVDKNGMNMLMHAAISGNLEVLQFIYEKKSDVDVNAVDHNGWTGLMHGVQSGDLYIVEFLLSVGASVNMANNDGRTAIFIATTHEYTDIQHLLTLYMPYTHPTKVTSFTQMPIECFIPAIEVKLQQFIGSEKLGGNYHALWLDAKVVVKLFVPEASATTFAHEVGVWHQLRHPNVIKLYGACDVGHRFFVCEWASNGSLVEYLSACEKRGEQINPWKFAHQAALGLAYLHERKIVHGNLCSNNILVGSDGLVKLVDFQLSISTLTPGEQKEADFGSLRWQAPEKLKGEQMSLASDIYSFGLCVVAVVTGKTPWEDCHNDSCKMLKEAWDATTDPRYYAPVSMTKNLAQLASKMCGNDPHSRISALEVTRELESLALQESKEKQSVQSKPEFIEQINQYKAGDMLRLWQALQDVVSTVPSNQPFFSELKLLYDHLSGEKRSILLLGQFFQLVADVIRVIDVGSRQYQILRLSSSKAQSRSMTGIYRRIDAIWSAIADSHTTKEIKLRRDEQKLKQQDIFVSEVSKTLIVLDELETAEVRESFVAFLKAEIDSHGSSHSTEQLSVLEKVFLDFNASLKSDAVAVMPKWFLPWYELEFDGVNYLTEGGFGEIYRAKWLESEVIVKQVKLPGSNNSDSCEDDSLLGKTIPQTQSIEEKRKEIREMFQHEVSAWFSLSHPYVVRLFGACHVGTPVFVCEFASNGSLDRYLRKHPKEIWHKLHEAALGVQYLHARDIIHGDLKCNNIVVGGDNKAKVTDFGLSSANVVTGAWRWVALECLERGSSELSPASDIYALGMCIVEALRIVEQTTTNNKDYVPLPWGNLDNNVVKHRVINKKELPSRPKLSTDDEWKLVKRMCAYDPKERIKISTVVDELAGLAGINKLLSPKMIERESVILSQKEVETMKCICSLEQQNQQDTSSMNQVVLHSVYGLLWDRFLDLCAIPSIEFGCLQSLFNSARASTQKIKYCSNTLTGFTKMAMNGYALHRELDKVIEANFWCVDAATGGIHDWQSKCTYAVCTPELDSTSQENNDQ